MSHDVTFARLIDAQPGEVFDAFTDPRGQREFYGPYRHRHVFRVIERPRRLVLTTAETHPDGSSFLTELEFTFEAQDGKTLMTMAHRASRAPRSVISTSAACRTHSTGSSE
jgi:uncharacterized protein YndB with AHSA1/START domain